MVSIAYWVPKLFHQSVQGIISLLIGTQAESAASFHPTLPMVQEDRLARGGYIVALFTELSTACGRKDGTNASGGVPIGALWELGRLSPGVE